MEHKASDKRLQAELAQLARLRLEEQKCLERIDLTTPPVEGLYCPMLWDGVICWPYVPAGALHKEHCPDYVYGFDPKAFAERWCTPSGSWLVNKETNNSWTNFTSCTLSEFDPLENLEHLDLYNNTIVEPHLQAIKLISKIGYSISLGTLLIAFIILSCIKRLRCPRNNLHMQLFLSFIMRATMFLLKNSLFVAGVGLRVNVTLSVEGIPIYVDPEFGVDCKIFMSFWHYFLMANYSWILMEGIYLHNLVFLAMFTDSSSIFTYVLLGWGLPVMSIVPWIIVRATLEDTLCWTTNDHPGYFWIIRGPITLAILINFVLFLNVTRVIFLKMFSSQTSHFRRYKYRKWFRSTLVLVPLFGVHYTILLAMAFFAGDNSPVEVAWLYVDQFFSSFQGFFVALLYCFLNGEVQTEVWKSWKKWKAIYTPHHFQSQPSLFSQSITHLSRGRNSTQSLHSSMGTEFKKSIEKKEVLPSSSPSPLLPEGRTSYHKDNPTKANHIQTSPAKPASHHTSNDSHMSTDTKTTPDLSRSQSMIELYPGKDSVDTKNVVQPETKTLRTFISHSFKGRDGKHSSMKPPLCTDKQGLLTSQTRVRESSF